MTKKVLTPVELQLLALVTSERSGREVARLCREETGEPVPFGTLYATFRRLRRRGFVQMRSDQYEDGRVRFFLITNAGAHVLERSRAHYARVSTFGVQSSSTPREER